MVSVRFLPLPVYLLDASDTPDKVAKDQLPLLTKMFTDMIRELNKISAEKIRAGK